MLLPPLPPAPSWYPGHMSKFARALPTLLGQTHVVIEARDARLPLTSINPNLETALTKWKSDREKMGSATGATVCERIVVYTKRDLISRRGEEPLRKALMKHFDHKVHFNATGSPRDLRALHATLVSIANKNRETTPHLNILVVGMPNIGKSTLLNNLRWAGTSNATKALRTSAQPGLTRALSERLKLNFEPPIYAVDSPGVMLPFLGRGDEGKERGVKLALIAGIKESLYDIESLAAYLQYRLNHLNPESPAYLSVLSPASAKRTDDFEELLFLISQKHGAVKRGGDYDYERAARWFVKWWQEGGAVSHPEPNGWGFDFDFGGEYDTASHENGQDPSPAALEPVSLLENKFDDTVSRFVAAMRSAEDGMGEISPTKEKKLAREAMTKARDEKRKTAFEIRGTQSSRQ